MSNHFHLLADLTACEDRRCVSESIGALQSTYAKYFNERTERRGPLFEPRFLSFGVDGDTATQRCARYIHRNPIAICGPRALGNYRWSSLPVLLGRRDSPPWLDCSLFVPHDPTAHLAELAAISDTDRLPLGGLPPQRRTTVDDIEESLTQLDSSTIGERTHRSLLCLLALEFRAADVRSLAGRLDIDPSNVRRLAKRSHLRRVDDPQFARLVSKVTAALPQHSKTPEGAWHFRASRTTRSSR